MPNEKYRALLFRTITALGVVLAFFLILIVPQHMLESTDWAFQDATQNFSHGQFTVAGITVALEESQTYKYGATLSQYVTVGDDRWALTEAPGYIFYLLPFYYIKAPELGNLALAIGMTAVAYLLLKRLRDEKTACIGALLLLFTPVALAMMQRTYADTFGATAFLSIGGGLYIYYCLKQQELTSRTGVLLLFLSGLGLGMAVAASYYNFFVVIVFALHFIFMSVRSWRAGHRGAAVRAVIWTLLGLAIPLAGLLVYQNAVFGSPFSVGFQYIKLPGNFGWRYLSSNVRYVTVALLVGFPLLLPGAAGFCISVYQKIVAFERGHRSGEVIDSWPELHWDILLLLAGWIAAVYGLYLNYAWTASTQIAGMPFIVMARYYLPAALPLTIMAVLLLTRVPRKLSLSVAILAVVWGGVFFAQSALSLPAVPSKSSSNPTASALPENTNAAFSLLRVEHQNTDSGMFLS